MRVLITGPTGFIGGHNLRRLLLEKCEIHAVNRAGRAEGGSRVIWHAADLRDSAEARAIVAKVRPTHLLHGAWIATPRVYSYSPENEAWLHSTVALAWAFGEYGGTRFVGIGSSAEYDANDWPCVEDETRIAPSTIYGKCKAGAWLGIQAAAQNYKFAAAWGRLFLPYGPGDSPHRLVPSVVAALSARKPVETTHGNQRRDFIYAPDAADLYVRLLLSKETGVFNVGSGSATTIRTVIEFLADRQHGRELLKFGAIKPPENEPLVLLADMSKVKARLGWIAPTSINTGLSNVLEQLANNKRIDV